MTYLISPTGQLRNLFPSGFPSALACPQFGSQTRIGQVESGFLPTEESGYNRGPEVVVMTLTPELKQAVEEAGPELALIENPGAHTACPVVVLIP
jgi:hypothetical protein